MKGINRETIGFIALLIVFTLFVGLLVLYSRGELDKISSFFEKLIKVTE